MMPFTKEQIQQANNVNLIDFVRQNGYILESGGRRSFHAKDSGGLYFFKDNNKYYHFATGTGGGIIDFVIQFFNKNFTEAVELLIGSTWTTSLPIKTKFKPKERGELELPPKAADFKRVYWYLISIRGIDPEIVSRLMNEKKIYQQADHGNCVFVSYDNEGKARYCTLRGTYQNKSFRMDIENSDKSYPFHISGTSNKVYVFESPIDAMSHTTLTKLYNDDWKKDHRISLGGVSDLALERFLKENPYIKHITLCLDNDEAGRFNMQKMMKKYNEKYTVKIQLPNSKDFNEDLQIFRSREYETESVLGEEYER